MTTTMRYIPSAERVGIDIVLLIQLAPVHHVGAGSALRRFRRIGRHGNLLPCAMSINVDIQRFAFGLTLKVDHDRGSLSEFNFSIKSLRSGVFCPWSESAPKQRLTVAS